MTRSILHSALSVAIMTIAGTAFAQGTRPDPMPPAGSPPTTQDSPMETPSQVPPSRPGPDMGAPGGASQPSAKPAIPPSSIIDKDVVDTQGEKLGEVAHVVGGNVIVSVGGFLGIGSRDVVVPWSQLTMIGSGDDAKLETTLGKEQLRQLPEYRAPRTDGGSGDRLPDASGGIRR
jgi:hypothetical protein